MRSLHVIGYGSIAQALEVRLRAAHEGGQLSLSQVSFNAPEIKTPKSEGIFTWRQCRKLNSDKTMNEVLDGLSASGGDLVIELGTRVDTRSLWLECKSRGLHFVNTGFDTWGGELDITQLDVLVRQNPSFKNGSGATCVLSMGMNPGIVNHFVAHGLKLATGKSDVKEAAAEFGLKAIVFSERDNQRPHSRTEEERTLRENQEEVLHCTWAPTQFLVESRESVLTWPGVPKEAEEIGSGDPTFLGWVPSGPIVGFAAPHDETYTCQSFLEKSVPALFLYEAPPAARHFIKGKSTADSEKVKCNLLTPARYNVREDCYDTIGVVLLSSKAGQVPFWCGNLMTVADAAEFDSTRKNGPTPMQVVGGVWAAIQFILKNPDAGDCYPEDVPTEFVMEHAFPYAGRLIARPCPEALQVRGFFDPAAEDVMDRILANQLDTSRTKKGKSRIHGSGIFAFKPLLAGTVVAQLPISQPVLTSRQFKTSNHFNHSCAPNAYVDRNHAVRTLSAVRKGEEITIDYALTAARGACGCAAIAIDKCKCQAVCCRKSVHDWTAIGAGTLLDYLRTTAILQEVEEDILGEMSSFPYCPGTAPDPRVLSPSRRMENEGKQARVEKAGRKSSVAKRKASAVKRKAPVARKAPAAKRRKQTV